MKQFDRYSILLKATTPFQFLKVFVEPARRIFNPIASDQAGACNTLPIICPCRGRIYRTPCTRRLWRNSSWSVRVTASLLGPDRASGFLSSRDPLESRSTQRFCSWVRGDRKSAKDRAGNAFVRCTHASRPIESESSWPSNSLRTWKCAARRIVFAETLPFAKRGLWNSIFPEVLRNRPGPRFIRRRSRIPRFGGPA